MSFFKQTHSLKDFFSTGQQFVYRKGEIILRDGDIPSGVYYIVDGFVKVHSLNLDGSENLHVILKPGEVFPRNWIFDLSVEHVSFEAITPVTIRRKPKEALVALLNADNDALREVLRIAIEFIDVLLNRVENLELTASYPRVINRLLQLARRFGERSEQEVRFLAPITHTNIANSINMSRETASRELEKLKKKNIIAEENHIIIIKDLSKLEKELTTYFEKK